MRKILRGAGAVAALEQAEESQLRVQGGLQPYSRPHAHRLLGLQIALGRLQERGAELTNADPGLHTVLEAQLPQKLPAEGLQAGEKIAVCLGALNEKDHLVSQLGVHGGAVPLAHLFGDHIVDIAQILVGAFGGELYRHRRHIPLEVPVVGPRPAVNLLQGGEAAKEQVLHKLVPVSGGDLHIGDLLLCVQLQHRSRVLGGNSCVGPLILRLRIVPGENEVAIGDAVHLLNKVGVAAEKDLQGRRRLPDGDGLRCAAAVQTLKIGVPVEDWPAKDLREAVQNLLGFPALEGEVGKGGVDRLRKAELPVLQIVDLQQNPVDDVHKGEAQGNGDQRKVQLVGQLDASRGHLLHEAADLQPDGGHADTAAGADQIQ